MKSLKHFRLYMWDRANMAIGYSFQSQSDLKLGNGIPLFILRIIETHSFRKHKLLLNPKTCWNSWCPVFLHKVYLLMPEPHKCSKWRELLCSALASVPTSWDRCSSRLSCDYIQSVSASYAYYCSLIDFKCVWGNDYCVWSFIWMLWKLPNKSEFLKMIAADLGVAEITVKLSDIVAQKCSGCYRPTFRVGGLRRDDGKPEWLTAVSHAHTLFIGGQAVAVSPVVLVLTPGYWWSGAF